MICKHCGSTLEDNTIICPRCGFIHGPEEPIGSKSRVIAGLLGIFFGWLGIHNFYLGFTGKGFAQLLITLVSLGTLGFITLIWGIVEGIRCFSGGIRLDARGTRLK